MKTGVLAVFFFLGALAAHAADVSVYAAVSLTDALKAIAPKFEAATGDKLRFNLDGSNVLALQITKGAPTDVFFSADEAQMDKLQKAGLIDASTRQDIVFNRLVAVVGADSPLQLTSLIDLAKPEVKHLALADTRSVPAGVYAKQYLQAAKVWDQVEARVVPTQNVRAALAGVESGNADAGIVYQTDALISKKVKVAFALPESPKVKIAYPAAALAHAPNAEGAKRLVLYLLNDPDARAVFAQYGFLVGPPAHGQ
ncbi:MAG TPA: molybdate ABC transporter substrate-binding protein [Candidatus Methylacidiphilales bacterium]|jgi:molybdate transport system substrate-binding protein|nr:molybdate ABC transporter substrate-binding protein [Candidatus Methylacidiphilales bacterium]